MNSTLELNLRLEILRTLDQCGGYLLSEHSLWHQTRLAFQPPPLAAEFAAALQFLEAQRWLVGVRPQLGGPVKWKITDLGRAALAEQN